MRRIARAAFLGDSQRVGHPDDAGYIFGAGTAPSLLPAAIDLWQQWRAAPRIQHADTLWAVEFVRRQRQQIDVQHVDVKWQRAGRLHRVGVQQHTAFAADRP